MSSKKGKSSSNLNGASEDGVDSKQVSQIPPTKWGWGRKQPPQNEVLAWDLFSFKQMFLIALVLTLALFFALGLSLSWLTLALFPVAYLVILLPVFLGSAYVYSRIHRARHPKFDQSYIKFKDAAFERKWKGRKIPIAIFYEAYFDSKFDVEGDLLTALYSRYDFLDVVFTMEHLKFFVGKLLPETLAHSREQDREQVTDHYNRGNDFYGWFLGETMIYTSGIFNNPEETLEEAQTNKLNIVCNKIHLQKGERLLDIGCGWGTLVMHAAKNFGADATGITIANEQVQFANERIKKNGVDKLARSLCMDYRDIPQAKYDKITCLEMSEHVGIKRYGAFLRQVSSLLKDDGIFYLQIAGLRRAFQYEDLCWGVFMGTYVFPGADASMPLAWVVGQLESNGFEIRSVETVGIHYSATIKRWYDNWVRNRDKVVAKYGERWYRKWEWFLGWAVISPEEGFATCFQIVTHKNLRKFDRKQFIAERVNWKC